MQKKKRRRKQKKKGWAGLPSLLSPRFDVSPYPSCPSLFNPQHLTFASSCDGCKSGYSQIHVFHPGGGEATSPSLRVGILYLVSFLKAADQGHSTPA